MIGIGLSITKQSPVRASITYPATDLVHALIYPDGVSIGTGWTAAVGPNLTQVGTLTSDGTTGVKGWSTSNYYSHSNIGGLSSKPFTFVGAFNRSSTSHNWMSFVNSAVSGIPMVLGLGSTWYVAGDSSSFANGATFTPTGSILLRCRRASNNVIYLAWTGQAEFEVSGGNNPFTQAFTFNRLGARPLYDASGATVGELSRFIYTGDNGDLVASGKWSELAAWYSSKHGVSL